jgi:hypothetical protein
MKLNIHHLHRRSVDAGLACLDHKSLSLPITIHSRPLVSRSQQSTGSQQEALLRKLKRASANFVNVGQSSQMA